MRRIVPLLVTLALVLLAGGLSAAATWTLTRDEPIRTTAGPTYPREVGRLPLRIAHGHPGRTIALVNSVGWTGGRLLAFAADSNRLRRVEGPDDDIEDPSSLLAPDGTRMATSSIGGDEIAVENLATGAVRRYHLGDNGSAPQVLAWSPDSGRLAIWWDAYVVLDLASGRTWRMNPVRLDDRASSPVAAFSPDGRALAYQDDTSIVLAGTDGSSPHRLGVDDVVLSGPNSWTPDGKRLVVARDDYFSEDEGTTTLLTVDVATRRTEVIRVFSMSEFGAPTVAGWRGGAEMLLTGSLGDGETVVDAYGLDGTRHDRLMDLGTSTYSVQLAVGLLPDATPRTTASQTGGLPTPLTAGVGVAAADVGLASGALVAAVVALVANRRRRPRAVVPGPVLEPGDVRDIVRPADDGDWARPR